MKIYERQRGDARMSGFGFGRTGEGLAREGGVQERRSAARYDPGVLVIAAVTLATVSFLMSRQKDLKPFTRAVLIGYGCLAVGGGALALAPLVLPFSLSLWGCAAVVLGVAALALVVERMFTFFSRHPSEA